MWKRQTAGARVRTTSASETCRTINGHREGNPKQGRATEKIVWFPDHSKNRPTRKGLGKRTALQCRSVLWKDLGTRLLQRVMYPTCEAHISLSTWWPWIMLSLRRTESSDSTLMLTISNRWSLRTGMISTFRHRQLLSSTHVFTYHVWESTTSCCCWWWQWYITLGISRYNTLGASRYTILVYYRKLVFGICNHSTNCLFHFWLCSLIKLQSF